MKILFLPVPEQHVLSDMISRAEAGLLQSQKEVGYVFLNKTEVN